MKSENLTPHIAAKATPMHKVCVDCGTHEADAWHLRRSTIRRELRRHHLSQREMALAEIILDMTMGWQRESIIVPQLQCFTDLTGISKSHVSEGIADLHMMRIIRVITDKGQPTYSIREDIENWKVKPRVTERAMCNSINLVREWNALPPLTEPLEAIANFKSGHHAKKAGAFVPKSGVPYVFPDELPNLFES
jgi:phage replication O-like protein O